MKDTGFPSDSEFVCDEKENNADNEIKCDSLPQRDARALVFYLLYAMDSFNYEVSLESVVDNFSRGFNVCVDQKGSVFEKAQAVIDAKDELDADMIPLLSNWKLDRLGTSTRLILRLALWEFKNTDLSASIIINEAVELAKCFAEHDAYKFVNGVLDQWVNRSPTEIPQ